MMTYFCAFLSLNLSVVLSQNELLACQASVEQKTMQMKNKNHSSVKTGPKGRIKHSNT